MGRTRSIPAEVERLIETVVQQKIWSKNKFVANDKAAGQLARKVLKASGQTGMFDATGTIAPDGQGWVERHSSDGDPNSERIAPKRRHQCPHMGGTPTPEK